MYVKCINQSGTGDRIFDVGPTVQTGSVPWWPDNQGGLSPSEAHISDITERLGVAADSYDLTLIHPEPFGYKDGDPTRPFWKLRWARFDGREGVHLVVCTGPIYVLGDSGKTIDKVG